MMKNLAMSGRLLPVPLVLCVRASCTEGLVTKRSRSYISQQVTHPGWVTFLLIKLSDPPPGV